MFYDYTDLESMIQLQDCCTVLHARLKQCMEWSPPTTRVTSGIYNPSRPTSEAELSLPLKTNQVKLEPLQVRPLLHAKSLHTKVFDMFRNLHLGEAGLILQRKLRVINTRLAAH